MFFRILSIRGGLMGLLPSDIAPLDDEAEDHLFLGLGCVEDGFFD